MSRVFRSRATGVVSLAIAVLAQTASSRLSEAAAERPNILFCLADNHSWPHVSALGNRAIETRSFDRVAREGVLFTHAFACAPSCTPSRSGILTGQDIWRLQEGANLYGTLPAKFAVYPDLLEQAGYHVGYAGKGWGPGRIEPGGRSLTKDYMMARHNDPQVRPLYRLAFAKRPAEELYDLSRDPHQIKNVAGETAYGAVKSELAGRLDKYLEQTGDPRALGLKAPWDAYPYCGKKLLEFDPRAFTPTQEGVTP
jgi:hypothetical protein